MSMHSRYDLYWLAGIIEGEGSFTLRCDGSVCVKVASTDLDVVERIAKIAGKGTVHGPYNRKGSRGNNKTQWEWWVYGPTAISIMLTLRRLMSSRRQEQIDHCLSGYKDGWAYSIKDVLGL